MSVQYNDGRELELLNYIFSLPEDRISQLRNNPDAVIACIDDFARTRKFLMTIGPFKRQVVLDVLNNKKPTTGIECGVYIGYSAILLGNAIRRHGGSKGRLYCLEKNPTFAAVAFALVDLAGLAENVKVLNIFTAEKSYANTAGR